jgi:hypothetical protein
VILGHEGGGIVKSLPLHVLEADLCLQGGISWYRCNQPLCGMAATVSRY